MLSTIQGAGGDTGTFVCDLGEGDEPDPNPPVIVSRASLLRELLKPLPREALHADKQVDSIQETSDGVEVTFRDGQTVSFDGLIGADGIFGTVRQYVVEKDECTATSTGFWDCRNVIPFDQAVAAFGDEYFKVDREYGWVGDGTFFLLNVIENKTMVQCLMSGVEKEPPSNRVQVLTREILEEKLQGSLESPITKKMVDVNLTSPSSRPRLPSHRFCSTNHVPRHTLPMSTREHPRMPKDASASLAMQHMQCRLGRGPAVGKLSRTP